MEHTYENCPNFTCRTKIHEEGYRHAQVDMIDELLSLSRKRLAEIQDIIGKAPETSGIPYLLAENKWWLDRIQEMIDR